jgi:serine protease Do
VIAKSLLVIFTLAVVGAIGMALFGPSEPRDALPAATPAPPAPAARTEAATTPAAGPPPPLPSDPETLTAVGRRLLPSIVTVEFHLRYDGGEPPSSLAWDEDRLRDLQKEGRPYETRGYLLSSDRVVVSDPEIPARFVEKIVAARGAHRATAWIAAWPKQHDALVLALEHALPETTGLAFGTDRGAPYYAVTQVEAGMDWATLVRPAFDELHVAEDGHGAAYFDRPALIVDRDATPVAFTSDHWISFHRLWKGSPLAWPMVDAKEEEANVAEALARAKLGLFRVRIRLRPLGPAEEGRRSRRYDDDDDENATEREVVGVLTDETHLLVLARLDAATTARIESVEAYREDGGPVALRLVSSYANVGAFLAESPSPLARPVTLRPGTVRSVQNDLLSDVTLVVRGVERDFHAGAMRVTRFDTGWGGRIEPHATGGAASHFLFDAEGRLFAVPVLPRQTAREEYRYRRERAILLGGEYLADIVARPATFADPSLVPASGGDARTSAWLGVETQPLDRDLARANGVSAVTRDGAIGFLVSYVYPDSPAARAGIKPGYVLVRIWHGTRERPIELKGRTDPMESMRSRLLRRFGRSAFDDEDSGILPWPSVENDLNKTITDLGVGTKFTLEFVAAAAPEFADLTVEAAPPHFESASSSRVEAFGVTVRDLTYEVRRYFLLDGTSPGVIVSRVDRGSRAEVAGLHRFDVIVDVNGRPVENAEAFGKALGEGKDARLTVRNMLKQSVIRLSFPPR